MKDSNREMKVELFMNLFIPKRDWWIFWLWETLNIERVLSCVGFTSNSFRGFLPYYFLDDYGFTFRFFWWFLYLSLLSLFI
jgi:hypothetical protein